MTGWGLGVAGVARIEAWVEPADTASERVLTACGYSKEGLLRSYLVISGRRTDVLVYSRVDG